MAATTKDAYCTLLMSDNYLPGAMVLAHSLRDNATKKELAVLVTLDSLQSTTLDELKTIYDHIIPVDRINNKSPANLMLMNRPDLASTFTKIALWKLTQFRRIVYLDADIVTLRAPDELFDLQSTFGAAPDIGWPDCFNSGVLALTPNTGDYYALLALAQRGISFDGADQGLLNMHFRNWQRLSFTYNCTPSGHYQYVPAYRHFQSSINAVHYIGHDKPWIVGREVKGGAGVYEELLARWWAVYERHYRVPKTAYISGQSSRRPNTVQQYVTGESSDAEYGFSSPNVLEHSTPSAARLLADESKKAEGEVQPALAIEKHPFSAPQTQWDPIHQAPPHGSRPEAPNLASHTYNMSADRNLFQAPTSYPEPPTGMWYEIPKSPDVHERPKPIFPWEENTPKPTRVFAEDGATRKEPALPTATEDNSQDNTTNPSTPNVYVDPTDPPFAAFSRTNAWDDVPEIERYISNIQQHRKGKIEVIHNTNDSNNEVLSPGVEGAPQPRRPSMKLTDFPTEIERPSLPVTPAPVRRPSFWGEERDGAGRLPGAEGVPSQDKWDPMAKLEELQRKQSEVLSQGPARSPTSIPNRKLPESAVLVPTSEETIIPPTSIVGDESSDSTTKFHAPDFEASNSMRSGEDEGVFSPTES